MADFEAVLRKTIDGLGATTPDMRAKVYDKARATIAAKLAALDPPPAQAVVDRQKKALEDAIGAVEASYAPPSPADDLESIFESLKTPTLSRMTPPQEEAVPSGRSSEAAMTAASAGQAPEAGQATSTVTEPHGEAAPAEANEPVYGPEVDQPVSAPHADPMAVPGRSGRSGFRLGLLAALVALLVIAGGGYAVWLNKDAMVAMLGSFGGAAPQEEPRTEPTIVLSGDEEGTDLPEEEAVAAEPEPPTDAEAPADGSAEEEIAAVDAGPAGEEEATELSAPQKFTQRLLEDGTEVDMGPAEGGAGVGEGTSVATTVIPEAPPAGPVDDGAEAATTAESSLQQDAGGQPGIAVGQRAIFYEERTSSAQGSAETGSIIWTLVQESPGGDAPPEPAIRAEASIPDKDLQLRMTIRRNVDQSLPASHIVEMIFLTPDDFDGGGIENVLRMTMKSSEEAPGTPLLGIPAKIADGFFLIALSDAEGDIAQNMNLLVSEQWIDIPMVYLSGRRALITMEKGIPGARVFEQALEAWRSGSSG